MKTNAVTHSIPEFSSHRSAPIVLPSSTLGSPADRRTFLRVAGVSLALPLLDYFLPRTRAGEKAPAVPRRMVCICTPLGLHPTNFFPEQAGKDYALTPYLLTIAVRISAISALVMGRLLTQARCSLDGSQPGDRSPG